VEPFSVFGSSATSDRSDCPYDSSQLGPLEPANPSEHGEESVQEFSHDSDDSLQPSFSVVQPTYLIRLRLSSWPVEIF